ncbi:GH39 family glycosyl hydrolase [Propionibacteriaceae bacterium Y2011]
MTPGRAATVRFDTSTPTTTLRPLNGVNGTSVSGNYWLDLSDWYRRWQIPVVRLHDAPFDAHNTVDLHHLFPDPEADPDDPANYDFVLTDDLISHVRATGAEVYFRLGESIEHQPRLRWNTMARWRPDALARVCAGVVRHYNHGWADGHEWGIRYWEFWNEPHGPKNWDGTPEEFFDRYRAVAPAVRAASPVAKVGLAGFTTTIVDDESPWGAGIRALAADGVPMDFLSWHRYPASITEYTAGAIAIREFLDQLGLSEVESHLGEWAFRPAHGENGQINIFAAYKRGRYDQVSQLTAEMQGPAGLAHVLGALISFQGLPIDQAHYYTANTSPRWGLFTADGLVSLRGLAFELYGDCLRRGGAVNIAETDDAEVQAILARDRELPRWRVLLANTAAEVDTVEVTIEHEHPLAVEQMAVHDGSGQVAVLPPLPHAAGRVTRFTVPVAGPGVVVLDVVPASEVVDTRSPEVNEHGQDGDW